MEFTEFEGKVALITGAASGMGLLFAENIASLGGNAVMCDVNEEVLFEKVAEINKKGKGKAIGIICDVREYENACMARDEAVKAFGRIDILANFAGGTAVRMQKAPASATRPLEITRPSTLLKLVLMPCARAMFWLAPVARRELPLSVPKYQ